jgi:hypothetical protein
MPLDKTGRGRKADRAGMRASGSTRRLRTSGFWHRHEGLLCASGLGSSGVTPRTRCLRPTVGPRSSRRVMIRSDSSVNVPAVVAGAMRRHLRPPLIIRAIGASGRLDAIVVSQRSHGFVPNYIPELGTSWCRNSPGKRALFGRKGDQSCTSVVTLLVALNTGASRPLQWRSSCALRTLSGRTHGAAAPSGYPRRRLARLMLQDVP